MSSDIPSAGGIEDDSQNPCLKPTFDSEPSFEEHTSSANLSSDESLSTFSLKDLIKDDQLVQDSDYKKSYAVTNITQREGNTEVASPGQKSPLFRHKDNRETSPFKEALKGFVLSRLAKKPSSAETLNTLDGDRRTLFSGIKKIVKKLEDSSSKESVCSKDICFNASDLNASAVTPNTLRKSECELKSVVANDHSDPVVVEEAEECFEEIKITFTSSSNGVTCDNVSAGDSCPVPSVAPRSKTMSNIAATAQQMLRPRMTSDKNLSISFSDLQRANDLDEDSDMLEAEEAFPSIPSIEDKHGSAVQNSSSCAVEPNHNVDRANVTDSPQPVRSLSVSLKRIMRFPKFLEGHLKKSVITDMLVLVTAIATYYFFYNRPFFAGLLCGVLLVVFLWILYSEFTNALMQNDHVPTPTYKTLPPLTKIPLNEHASVHEGWMNQLNGEYNPDSYKLTDTVSVFVRIQEDKLFLSYPKKNIPRRAMWNEKKMHNNPVIREDTFILRGAKIVLLPEGLRCSRIWNKRYPLCIMLAKDDQKRSSSVDSTSKSDDKDSELNTKPPSSSSSQSGSLSGTPVHVATNQNVFYLFSRTDREKEVWYWKLYCASRISLEEQTSDVHGLDYASVDSEPDSGGTPGTSVVQKSSKSSLSTLKDEEAKTSHHKPVIDFDHYMELLIKQELIDVKSKELQNEPRVQWLNVFLGRLFFDFFVQKKWADRVMERIQYKLDRIKMPQYMRKLVVTDVYLGTCLPQIQNISEAVVDERGLWLDLDINYQGYFQMTLETKLKSRTRPVLPGERHPGEESSVLVPELAGEVVSEELPEYWDEEEELPDSEASKDDSPLHQSSLSTGAKLLHSVEKWVTSSNIAENSFVRRYVDQLMHARLLLTVEIDSLCGTLAVNLPPLPTDRLWYGFRTNPVLSLNVFPKVGERHISLLPVVQLIKRKLLQEFQKAVVMPNMDDIMVPIMHSSVYDQ